MSNIQIGDIVEIISSVSSRLVGEVCEVVAIKNEGYTKFGVRFLNEEFDNHYWYDTGVNHRWFMGRNLRKTEIISDVSEDELLSIISNH